MSSYQSINKAKPLDKGFNVAVVHIANILMPTGFDVSLDAPQTYEELVHYYNVTRRIKVWSGASEQTIFDDAEVNYSFRAWHDHRHLTLGFTFQDVDEIKVMKQQQRDILDVYGRSDRTTYWLDILEAEVKGQLEYKTKYGNFPVNQKGFVEGYTKNKFKALSTTW